MHFTLTASSLNIGAELFLIVSPCIFSIAVIHNKCESVEAYYLFLHYNLVSLAMVTQPILFGGSGIASSSYKPRFLWEEGRSLRHCTRTIAFAGSVVIFTSLTGCSLYVVLANWLTCSW